MKIIENILAKIEPNDIVDGTVFVPARITDIGDEAFEDHDELINVVIPGSVTHIGWYAFCGCTNLKNIVYLDTKAKWDTIKTEFGWNRDTGKYTVHCTDGGICYERSMYHEQKAKLRKILNNGIRAGKSAEETKALLRLAKNNLCDQCYINALSQGYGKAFCDKNHTCFLNEALETYCRVADEKCAVPKPEPVEENEERPSTDLPTERR